MIALSICLTVLGVLALVWRFGPFWYVWQRWDGFTQPPSERFLKTFMLETDYPFRRGNGYGYRYARDRAFYVGWCRKFPDSDAAKQMGGRFVPREELEGMFEQWRPDAAEPSS